MLDLQENIDLSRYKWQEFNDVSHDGHLVHHDQTILDYDLERGTIDLITRWGKDGGHCMLHRHVARTTCIVLQGEQHFFDYDENGNRAAEPRIRTVGGHGLSKGPDKYPHMERGGPEGCVAFFSMHGDGPNAVIFEAFDADMNVAVGITIEMIVADFEANAR